MTSSPSAWLAILLGAIACSGDGGALSAAAAEREIDALHGLYDAQQFGTIYRDGTAGMRLLSTLDQAVAFYQKSFERLGRVQGSKTASWSRGATNGMDSITVVRKTRFERGSATESFTFVEKAGKIVLAGYDLE